MAKRRTAERILYDNFMALEANKWFMIAGRSDYEKNVAFIKEMIDNGESFEFDNAFRRFKRLDYSKQQFIRLPMFHTMDKLPEGFTVEKIEEGFKERVTAAKGREVTITHESDKYGKYKPSYRVFLGEKLIAIEL